MAVPPVPENTRTANDGSQVLWTLCCPEIAHPLIASLWHGTTPETWRIVVQCSGLHLAELEGDDYDLLLSAVFVIREVFCLKGWTNPSSGNGSLIGSACHASE
jgi:hypothetical protein